MGLFGKSETRPDFAATVTVRVKVRYAAPADGPHIASGDARHAGPDDHERNIRVYENRVEAARYAENTIVPAVTAAVAEVGEVVDVLLDGVEEVPE